MMDPLWSEICWSTFKYFIILIVSTYYILCISWTIMCLISIDARCKHEEPNHKIQHLAVPYVSVWCLMACGSGSPFFHMALHFRVTQSLCLSPRRCLSLWLRVFPFPQGGTRPRDSGSLLYCVTRHINVTQDLSRSFSLACDSVL